jgi:hypothetical protein
MPSTENSGLPKKKKTQMHAITPNDVRIAALRRCGGSMPSGHHQKNRRQKNGASKNSI